MKKMTAEFAFEHKCNKLNTFKVKCAAVKLTVYYVAKSYRIDPAKDNSFDFDGFHVDDEYPAALIQCLNDANEFAKKELAD